MLYLTLSWRRPISYRNQSIDLRKSMDWFLYDIGLRHERVKFKKISDYDQARSEGQKTKGKLNYSFDGRKQI